MIPEEAYRAEIKLDEQSVYGLCNSLNAWVPPMRNYGYERVAFYMLRAQGTISKLFEENRKLKQVLNEKSKSGNPCYKNLRNGEVEP